MTVNVPGAEEAEAAVIDAQDQPSIPAPDPAPEFYVIKSTAELYLRNLNIITGNSFIGGENNRADKQQYRLRAMDHALQLTIIDLQRAQVEKGEAQA